jgi:hypothetical protein
VLLFRGVREEQRQRLLLIFLVGDTATRGLHKEALLASLQFLQDAGLLRQPGAPVRILGPAFSGSQTSLARALRNWGERQCGTQRPRPVWIVSGSATACRPEEFGNSLPCPAPAAAAVGMLASPAAQGPLVAAFALQPARMSPLDIRFQATVIPEELVLKELFRYVRTRTPVAVLKEANTAFGQVALNGWYEKDLPSVVVIPFPMHISEVRTAYEKSAAGKGVGVPGLPSFVGKLRIPLEEARESRDVEPTLAPRMTAAYNERVLAGILATIARERIQYAVILATDVKDMIFLATVLRENVPDVRLLFSQSDILLSHPDYRYYLRGALVASTYPLYSRNQEWTFPFGGDEARILFPGQVEQGYYNAAVALLKDEGLPPSGPGNGAPANPGDVALSDLIEYGRPFGPEVDPQRPPVWISVLGQDGPHPLAFRDQEENEAYKAYVLPAPNPHLEPEFVFRHSRLWVWVFAGIMVAFAALGALYLFAPRRSRRGRARGLGGELLDLWAPRPADLRARQELYSFLCLGSLTVLWGYITFVSLIPHLVDLLGGVPGGGVLVYPVVPVVPGLAVLTLAGLLVATATAACRYRRARAQPAAGRPAAPKRQQRAGFLGLKSPRRGWRPFRRLLPILAARYFLPLAAAVLAVIVGGRLVYDWVIGLYQPLGFCGSAASALFYFERVTNVADGVTPVLPACFPALALCYWGLTQLKRLHQLDRALDPQGRGDPDGSPGGTVPAGGWSGRGVLGWIVLLLGRVGVLFWAPRVALWAAVNWLVGPAPAPTRSGRADPAPFPASGSATLGRLRARYEAALWAVQAPHAFGPHRLPGLAVWAALLFAFCRLGSGFTPTVEGTLIDCAMQFAFAAVVVLLVYTFLHALDVWRRLRRLLQQIAQLPLLKAFDRMPARVPSLFGPYLSSSSSYRESHLAVRVQQLRVLAEAYGGVRDQFPKVCDALDRALGYDAAATRLAEERSRRPWGSRFPEDAEETRARVREFLGNGDARLLCSAAACACFEAIDVAWPSLTVGEAYGRAPATEVADGAPAPAAATAGGEAPEAPPEPVRHWFGLAEDFLAIEVTNCLSHFFAQLRTLVTFVVLGSILLLPAVVSYPFQPQRLLLVFVAGLILLFAAGIFSMLVQIERDEVVSRILKTTPNRVTLHPAFLAHVGTYVLPLLGILATTSPEVSDLLHAWLDPVFQALK